MEKTTVKATFPKMRNATHIDTKIVCAPDIHKRILVSAADFVFSAEILHL